MSVRSKILALIAGGLLSLLSAGCGRDNSVTVAEIDEPSYREGQQLLRQGRTHEALAAYRKVIEKRGEQASAESHLEVGIIMMQHIKNPLEAIYHFSKYLEQQPNSHQAPLVKDQLEAAKRDFLKTLAAQPLESQSQRLDILEQIDRLQRENEQLKAELMATRTGDFNRPMNSTRVLLNDAPLARGSPPAMSAPREISPIVMAPLDAREAVSEPAPATLPPATTPPSSVASRGSRPLSKPTAPTRPAASVNSLRTYTVGTKETLWGVAGKAYGSATNARVRAIAEANRDLLPDGASSPLKTGMVLKIP